MRDRSEGGVEVRPIELFFDLVYVLAITQLTHHLLEHLTVRGAAETLLLLLAVWAAWNFTSWTTNYFEPGAPAVRLALLAVMFASLAMSSAIPEAFDDRALLFAGAYVALTIGRTFFALVGFGTGHPLRRVFTRPLVWWCAAGILWIAGAAAEGDARFALWGAGGGHRVHRPRGSAIRCRASAARARASTPSRASTWRSAACSSSRSRSASRS